MGKSAATIVEEKAAFTLFLSGAYRTSLSGEAKASKKELTALSEKIMKTANAGGDAQADLKKFIATAKITDQYNTPLTIWTPTQRRNAGAPTTDTVMDQSGSMGYSFYQTLPGEQEVSGTPGRLRASEVGRSVLRRRRRGGG